MNVIWTNKAKQTFEKKVEFLLFYWDEKQANIVPECSAPAPVAAFGSCCGSGGAHGKWSVECAHLLQLVPSQCP